MRIGFLGGTGVEGKGLALRFAAAGAEVVLGSRDPNRAESRAAEYNEILGRPAIAGMENSRMLFSSEIVFLTVPFDQAPAAIEPVRRHLSDRHIIVDVTVPMRCNGGTPAYQEQEGRSNAEIVARNLPAGIPLVCAFKTIPAHLLGLLDTPLDCDVFVCGDSEEARMCVMETASIIPSLRAIDAGPLETARILERMTVLAAALNRHYKKKGARYRIIGI